MALRSRHGKAARTGIGPMVEVPRPAELGVGVPARARPPVQRDSAGRFIRGAGLRELARAGGKAKAQSIKLARLLGLLELPADAPFAEYQQMARDWQAGFLEQLAEQVGAGQAGPGVAAIVSSAALELAGRCWAYDRFKETGDTARLIDASNLNRSLRQHILAAWHMAELEGKARAAATPADADAWLQRTPAGGAKT